MVDVNPKSQLLTPIKVGPFELPHRIITTAHVAFRVWDPNDPGDRYIEYQKRRAGGLAMAVLEPIWVEPHGTWPELLSEKMSRVAAAVKGEGARAVLQLVSYGGQAGLGYTMTGLSGRLLWSFSGRQSPYGPPSHRMSAGEIECMVEGFARAARVAAEAGMDGVELHGAHGYMIHESFSPWGNQRDDEWGERTAFTSAVMSACRQAMGPDKILGLRMAAMDDIPPARGGQTEDELCGIAAQFVEPGDVDYMNISVGSRAPHYANLSTATYRHDWGTELKYSARLRRAINGAVPVVGVGRILTPEQGEIALQRGDCDLVAMTRGHISDPDILAKVRSGESNRIRKCVGANECVDRSFGGITIACFHNPEVGREGRPLKIAQISKKVLVVGAGPAGLKAAEIATNRGHNVVLMDAAPEPGGRMRWIRATAAQPLWHSVEWLVQELELAKVDIVLNTRVDSQVVADVAPDTVVLATGAQADPKAAVENTGAARLISSEEALDGAAGDRVVVLDRIGAMEAGLVAEALCLAGKKVTYVTPFDQLVPFGGYSHRLDLQTVFRRNGCDLLTLADVGRVDAFGVAVVDLDGRVTRTVTADTLVAVTVAEPVLDLTDILDEQAVPYQVVGDAIAPRGVLSAIRDGYTAARAI
jgi:2,4-dienoyl-CoA reductase-like NADH-dependent reductase (Old Yellow Enzyme family)